LQTMIVKGSEQLGKLELGGLKQLQRLDVLNCCRLRQLEGG
jgi:hypothetical protein